MTEIFEWIWANHSIHQNRTEERYVNKGQIYIMNKIKKMENELSSIDIRELALKWRSKHEIYLKLTIDLNVYLPNESDVNSDFISDILQGRKK